MIVEGVKFYTGKMFGGSDGNAVFPFAGKNHCQTNPSNQLQLFGNVPVGCTVEPVTCIGNGQFIPMIRPAKRGRETEDIERLQKQKISLNYNIGQDPTDRSGTIQNANNVSTGLRLSYDDDEGPNSSLTTASGSMTATPSILMSLGDNIRSELDRQEEEFNQYIKIQEERLAKGAKDLKQRQTASFLCLIEKDLSKKLREKDLEIENVNRKNRELAEQIKQVAMEAQNWHCRAKYNESVINVLKSNLEQAVSQGADQGKEGFGDSEIDDTASYVNPNNYLTVPGAAAAKPVTWNQNGNMKQNMMLCRACKVKEVSILVMPCRHLCLCRDCDVFAGVCPVCQLIKTASVQVFLS